MMWRNFGGLQALSNCSVVVEGKDMEQPDRQKRTVGPPQYRGHQEFSFCCISMRCPTREDRLMSELFF